MPDLQPLQPLAKISKRRLSDDSGDWAMKSRETAERQIAEVLREKIIVGVLARGQKLKQAEIAKMLGVSITPVREALRLLEAQGYVSVSAHRGAVVAPFLIDGAEELYQLRQLLETRLTLEAARRMTSNDLHVLKSINHDLLTAARSGASTRSISSPSTNSSGMTGRATTPASGRSRKTAEISLAGWNTRLKEYE